MSEGQRLKVTCGPWQLLKKSSMFSETSIWSKHVQIETHVLSLMEQLLDLYLPFPSSSSSSPEFPSSCTLSSSLVLEDERSNLIFAVPWCTQLLFTNKNRVVGIIWACTPKGLLHKVLTWSNMTDKMFTIIYDLILLLQTFTSYVWPTRLKAIKLKALNFLMFLFNWTSKMLGCSIDH